MNSEYRACCVLLKPARSKGSEQAEGSVYKDQGLCSNTASPEEFMARISDDVVVASPPVRTFPNGDFLYVELSRKSSNYDCVLKMAREGDGKSPVVVAKAHGKTIRQAEQSCYEKALERCPRLPSPPYLKRGTRSRRMVTNFPPSNVKGSVKH